MTPRASKPPSRHSYIEPRHIRIVGASGHAAIYDIDSDGKVYWLQPRGEHYQRRLCDPRVTQLVKQVVDKETL